MGSPETSNRFVNREEMFLEQMAEEQNWYPDLEPKKDQEIGCKDCNALLQNFAE
jgi:hypothetical protein